ncbi:MAG: hypothetical protein IT349_10415 [Candidatus Eisenbacteria bacterium]|nr:hypothetical protein [Candidatus Eisenbacteria bacterium]
MLRRGLLRVWMGLSTISLSATLLGGTAVGSSRAECISADEYMQVVAQLDLNGNNLDIALMGTRLYLANEELGLAVVDVSDPYAPTLLSSLDTGTPITQVEAVNGLVYVADGVGLRIVKVNAAGAASVLGTFGASGTRRDLTVASGLAYFATAEFGVRVIDVGFPALPVERANIPLASPGKVRVRGQFAYIDYEVAQGEPSRLEVVDMSVPTSPLSVATLPDFCLGGASDFALSGDYLYAFDESDTLPIVDISTPSSPVKLAGTAYADYIPPEAIVIEGDVAYLTTYEVATIATWDLSNPTAPTLLGRLEEDNNLYSPFRLAVRAPFAYLMAGPLVQVIDVSSPLTPSIEGLLDTPGTATGVASVGSLNYVADGSDGLRIIDSTVPDAPVEVGALDTPGTASHVALAGDRAYVADGTGGVAVVDVSLPGLPLSLGTVPTSGFARRVRTSGGLLYVAASAAGLLVVDPQDPQSPIELGALPPVGATNDVAISASLAVTVEELGGTGRLAVADISNPASPVEIGSLPLSLPPHAVALAGGRAYVALGEIGAGHGGLAIVDLSTPTLPSLLGEWSLFAELIDVAVQDEWVYMIGQSEVEVEAGTLFVLNPAVPAQPTLVQRLFLPVRGLGLAVEGDLVRLADAGAGLLLTSAQCDATAAVPLPSSLTGTLPFPNPARAGDRIRWSLPFSQEETTLFDVRGREVIRLRASADGMVEWDGRSGSGRPAPAGIYYSRSGNLEAVRMHPIILLR